MLMKVLLTLFIVMITLFLLTAFTRRSLAYTRFFGVMAVIIAIILVAYSLFFQDKVKDNEPIGKITEGITDVKLGEVYSVEGVVDKIYKCSEYTNNKPQDVRVLEVNGIVCKLCPCEEEFINVGETVELKGRVYYNGDLIVLKGCYILEVN